MAYNSPENEGEARGRGAIISHNFQGKLDYNYYISHQTCIATVISGLL